MSEELVNKEELQEEEEIQEEDKESKPSQHPSTDSDRCREGRGEASLADRCLWRSTLDD